jgi:curved DNA-binding protein CbpA
MNPFEILGIPFDADDAAVRSAYLELVRRYPPERAPEKFKVINAAYQTLKDEKSRLHYHLFNRDSEIRSPLEALFVHFSLAEERIPLGSEDMKEYLRKCASQ